MQRESERAGHLFARRWLRRFVTLTLIALPCGIGITTLASCTSKQATTRRSGTSVLTVTVSCPSDLATTIVSRYGQLWASRAGAQLKVVRYDPQTGPESGPPADVWIVPPARMPHYAAAGQLHPVPSGILARGGSYAWDNMLPLYRYKLLVWDKDVFALPLLGDAFLAFFREDLLADPQHREAFKKQFGGDLTPPDTWEDLLQVAEYFHQKPRPGIDRPCPSLPPLPANADGVDREFYSVAVPFARRAIRQDDRKPPPDNAVFSFHYDLATHQLRLDSPGFVHALEVLQRLQKFRSPKTHDDPPTAFQKGEAVFCLAAPSWIVRFQENPHLRGKFGMLQVPGSRHVFDYTTGKAQVVPGGNFIPYLGADGLLGVVPRSNPEPETAFALLSSLSDPRTSRDIVIEPDWGGGIFRLEHVEGHLGWPAFGLSPAHTEQLITRLRETIVHYHVKNPVLRLRIPNEREYQQIVVAEVRAALLSNKPARQALADAAQQWRELDQRKDPKSRQAEYRLSLSLSRGGE